jgi:uncharacterized protein DUF6675
MRRPLAALLGALTLAMPTFLAGPAPAQERPRAACDGAPSLDYPAPGSTPTVAVWSDNRAWRPPACSGWTAPGFRLLVAVAGSFREDDGADGLLARFGAVSTLSGVRFWSASDRAWKPLVEVAAALNGPGVRGARPDFSVAEMKSGAPLYFVQGGGRTGDVVNRLRVREARPDRLVIEAENVSPIRLSIVQLFGPGDLQTLYVLERRAAGVWTYYSMTRVGNGASFLVSGHVDSFVNRAAALYRHFADLPAERGPPSAS